MKLFITSCLLLASLSISAQGISFFDGSYDEALAKAKEEGKMVFVDCYTTWCGPCKMMSANVFTDEEVGVFFNENFINIKIDMEKGEGPGLARKFMIRGYPTLIVINPEDGEEVDRNLGAMRIHQMLKFGKQVI